MGVLVDAVIGICPGSDPAGWMREVSVRPGGHSVRSHLVREVGQEHLVVGVHAVARHVVVGQEAELSVDHVIGEAPAVEEPGRVAESDRQGVRRRTLARLSMVASS